MRSDDRDLCDTLIRWAKDLESLGGDAARSANDLYAAAARIEQMSATIGEVLRPKRARRYTDQSEIERLRAENERLKQHARDEYDRGFASGVERRWEPHRHEEVQP